MYNCALIGNILIEITTRKQYTFEQRKEAGVNMIGRVEEIRHLEALYKSNSFEYLVMYGRRRVGKTTILQEFAKKNNAIFYPAQAKNDALNLEDFSKMIQMHFDGMFIASFSSWKEAFEYIDKKADKRTAIIIDEFPFLADEPHNIKNIFLFFFHK